MENKKKRNGRSKSFTGVGLASFLRSTVASFSSTFVPSSRGRSSFNHRNAFSGPIVSIVPPEARGGRRRQPSSSGYRTPEPCSPKVSCIGQIKRNKSKRAAAKVNPACGRNGGAPVWASRHTPPHGTRLASSSPAAEPAHASLPAPYGRPVALSPMNLSDDWRSLFPVASVFAPPSVARSRGPLIFSPLLPPAQLLSLPFPIPPPQLASSRGLHRFLRAYVSATSFLPLADLDSLARDILAPPPSPFPPPSNLLAVLHRPSSAPSWSLLVFFPYGENAEQVAFVNLDSDTVAGSTPPSPVVQGQGFRYPGQSIRLLTASAAKSSWPSEPGDKVVDGFLLAATLYSVNWFRIESRDSDSPALVPVAKQGFDAVVVHACWSRYFPSECIVLLENGELCWFDLDSCRGGKMRVRFSSNDDCGNWLSCDYGAHPWTVIVATSKSILLVDLRFGSCGEYKILAKVGMPGLFETDLFTGTDQYLAFCRAGFDHFHFCVVTERFLILLDVRQPLKPLLAWQHWLERPNNVAMFRLSDLRSSKEHELASNSGFAILVGSFFTGEFSLFCYGPEEQGCPENSRLYAWDLPSRFPLTGQHCSCSDGMMKDVLSMPVSGDGSSPQEKKNLTIGYHVLPNDVSMLGPSVAGFDMIRLTTFGKLEIQRYYASTDQCDIISCESSQHASRASSSFFYPHTQEDSASLRYSFMKLQFLLKQLEGNLSSALEKHDFFVIKEQMEQIIISEEVSEYAKDNSSSLFQPVSDFLCNASIPMNIFEVACQRVLNGLPSSVLQITFSTYKDMVACSAEGAVEHLGVPSLTRNELRPFLLAKPSTISDNLTSKVRHRDPLVGPVLPIDVLFAMEQRNKDVESSAQNALAETDLISDQCREVLEAFDPVISIADSFGSQRMDDEKSYFAYEPQIEMRFSSESARNNGKGDHNLDDPLHTSATTHQDKIFTTFVCGKTEIPESGPEQAAASVFDFGPVRMDFDPADMEIHPAEEKCCLQINSLLLPLPQMVGLRCNFGQYLPSTD